MAATPPPGGSRAYDGRLDPDDLDRALDLDVVDHGGPGRQGAEAGADGEDSPARGPLRLVAALAAVVVAGAVLVAVTRPDPPPPMPAVSVIAGGEADVRAEVDPVTGDVRALERLVVIDATGRGDVEVRTLGVRGPGLTEAYASVPVVSAGAARTGPVGAVVRCPDEAGIDAVLSARAADFRVALARTASDGASDEADAPLPGADQWLAAVRTVCVQAAARAGLRVVGATATAVPGAAATDLTLTVRNDSARQWADARLVAGDDRSVAPTGDPVDLAAGATADLRAVVWARDCSDPVGDLARGLVAEAAVNRTDGSGFAPLSQFRLGLDPTLLAPLEQALRAQCSGPVPLVTVERVRVPEGGREDSAGTLEITVRVAVPAASVGVGPVSDGSGQGRITSPQASWPVRAGSATATLRWALPSCLNLLTRGVVALPVRVSDDGVERRYLVDLRGEPLRIALARLCGPIVASVAR